MKAERHENADMICAKANNMNLVVLAKSLKWHKVDSEDFQFFNQHEEYFLCLPQHKEACLHWLNGGELNIDNGKGLGIGRYTLSIENNFPLCDFINHPEYTFIIKPRKEKRWIGVYGNHVTDGMYPTKELCERCVNRSDKFKHCAPEGWQFIEIEVEV